MKSLDRITFDPNVMGGKPCIRGMRVTVGTIVGLVASGYSFQEILEAYPYLEEEDIRQALAYAAWRAEEVELPLRVAVSQPEREKNASGAVDETARIRVLPFPVEESRDLQERALQCFLNRASVSTFATVGPTLPQWWTWRR
jgi:uncharacterized protein (DUF433 family)